MPNMKTLSLIYGLKVMDGQDEKLDAPNAIRGVGGGGGGGIKRIV